MNAEFLKISTYKNLANFLDITRSELKLATMLKSSFYYSQFEIPKKNGKKRQIFAPSDKLKNIQHILKAEFDKIYIVNDYVHGFCANKSIVTNAKSHLDRGHILNIDLENFFPSITFNRVENLFKSEPFGFNQRIANALASLCCYEGALPQGAPTSPVLSNFISCELDYKLNSLSTKFNCVYTRYVDDITISFKCKEFSKLPDSLVVVNNDDVVTGQLLTRIINDCGFTINQEKVRLYNQKYRMEVTGLTVNSVLNVRKKYIKQISAMLHAWGKFGIIAAQSDFDKKYHEKMFRLSFRQRKFQDVVRGKLSFLKNVRGADDPIYSKLLKQYIRLISMPLKK